MKAGLRGTLVVGCIGVAGWILRQGSDANIPTPAAESGLANQGASKPKGTLILSTNRTDLEVRLGSRKVGLAHQGGFALDSGRHELVIQGPCTQDWSRHVQVVPNGVTSISLDGLESRMAEIRLELPPETRGVSIWVDGVALERPAERISVPLCSKVLEVRSDEWVWQTDLALMENAETRIVVNATHLVRSQPGPSDALPEEPGEMSEARRSRELEGATGSPLEPERVFIPGGTAVHGCNLGVPECPMSSEPARMVTTQPFYIDRTEVTAARYQACVEAGVCERDPDHPQGGEHPVTHVRWQQAKVFCAWDGGRLPTEEEWERAARGDDGRLYPWGDEPPTCEHVNCSGATEPVGRRLPGAHGLLDMASNVAEWTTAECDVGQRISLRRTRGAPFLWDERTVALVFTVFAYGCALESGSLFVGFRCVRDASEIRDE